MIQAALGAEFVPAGLNKFVNLDYLLQFRGFVSASPGASRGPLAWVTQTLIVPGIDLAAQVARLTEVVVGAVLLLAALEVLRRRLAGPLGAQHGYEAGLALVSTAAALVTRPGTLCCLVGRCLSRHARQQSNTDQQMSFRNR